MNSTANQTTITVCTTEAKPLNNYSIKKRVERDARTGRERIVETVRGIRL